jgi:tRNA (adenine57-N1/adenine58-N1)-methyltransferase
VYPADANLIVSLLDLHPGVPGDGNEETLEIFEAGTGHGALTLHLARAIHAANPPAPPLPPAKVMKHSEPAAEGEAAFLEPDHQGITAEVKSAVDVYEAWKSSRRAVIHSLDISEQNSKHAQGTVKNFRRGVYYGNVDFHVGIISEYLSTRLAESPEPFLDHTILDLPAAHSHLEIVGRALKPNGSVVVFCPSITQINTCVQLVKQKHLPLLLETVLEIGAGVGVGGKEWDVRAVKPRALLKAEAETRDSPVEGESAKTSPSDEFEVKTEDSGWEMVCRPKVGGRISGGGFLGLFRRMEQY